MIKGEDIFTIIMGIIYFVCIFIEIKVLKRKKISIFYKENSLLIFIVSATLPLAMFIFFLSCGIIKDIFNNQNFEFNLWGFSIMFASLAYIIQYIKNRIYAFIPDVNKLSIIERRTIYDREER